MGILDQLSTPLFTPDEMYEERKGKPLPKNVDRLAEKTDRRKDDAKKLDAWKRAVRHRDRGRCRVCGTKTVQTAALTPKRGETHHLASRADWRVRHDRRNGLHVCFQCHRRLEKNEIRIIGTAAQMFQVDGRPYLNADEPLRIV